MPPPLLQTKLKPMLSLRLTVTDLFNHASTAGLLHTSGVRDPSDLISLDSGRDHQNDEAKEEVKCNEHAGKLARAIQMTEQVLELDIAFESYVKETVELVDVSKGNLEKIVFIS